MLRHRLPRSPPPPTPTITARFLSHLRLTLGVKKAQLEADTVSAALETLSSTFGPAFDEEIVRCRIYVNGASVGLGRGRRTRLQDGDEMVILPPVGGG
jgi:sulfur-carrier protein